ncbi:class I adenylate-forming enzyme family protein [Mariniluteicoccus endophyticus]
MPTDQTVTSGDNNLADAVRRHARSRPEAVALVERGDRRREVTWAELDRLVDQSAVAYDALGLVAGQRVAIVMANSVDAVSAWLGALRVGVVAVPFNPRLSDAEMARELVSCGATIILTDDDRQLPDGVRPVSLTGHGDGVEVTRIASVPDREALAALVFTSGSQGVPRAAMFTHRALLAACQQAARAGLGAEDAVALAMLPLCHMYGLNAVVGLTLHVGGTTVLVEGMVDDLCDLIVAEKVTHLPVTPSVLYRLQQDPGLPEATRSLRLVSSGAAPMPAVLGERFTLQTGLRVEQGYGQTEASPGIASTFGHELRGPGHVGRALPGVEVRIGDGSHPHDPAEVHVRGANLFSGYWPDGAEAPDADGWRATGDVGYMQGDDLFLLDRAGELIIVSGFNVYPSEIEEVLEQHESVSGAAVIGAPDERTGERVVAFLDAAKGRKVELASVRALARENLARYKVPAEFIVLKEIPRTPTGKPRKGDLRNMLDRMEEEV